MLEIRNLSVEVAGKPMLHNVNLAIDTGETHVLFGPNGSGKTSLLMTILGMPNYRVTAGDIYFKGQDITSLGVDERARLGIGASFQRPPVVRGVTLRRMAEVCLHDRGDGDRIGELAAMLQLTDFLDRDVNYGFSGGELKRSELLQLMAQDPELSLLDEPESGVDLVSIALVGETINRLLQKDLMRSRRHSGLIITHTGHILQYVKADRGHCLIDGTLVCGGNPLEMLDDIRVGGYRGCAECNR